MDGKPRFVRRLLAEYFAAKLFTENFSKCKYFIANILFKSTYEVTRNMFDRMLAEGSEIHAAVFNNYVRTLKEVLKEEKKANFADKGGITALHLAASYNSPVMQTVLSVPGVETTVVDKVLKWTSLMYAERTKSWLAMDILLQNGANPDDLVRTGRKRRRQSWGQTAFWERAQKGYKKVVEFILSCGTDVNAFVRVPENLHEKCTLLHIASLCGQVEVVSFLLESGADVNIPNSNNDTALHFAARSDSVDIIKLLLDKGMSADLTDTTASTPLQLSPACNKLAATMAFVKEGATLNKTNKSNLSPLMMSAYTGKLEAVRYLVERDADIN
jgi:serine/threonine-protein phosphatase 6 regulatory ankyrin repeat subunit B